MIVIMKNLSALVTLFIVVVAAASEGSAQTNGNGREMYVTVDRLIRRTCPSTSCGDVGGLLSGEKVIVLEERDGWARITRTYDAACQDGISAYVDKGNARCETSNGIIEGQMAEWVAIQFLGQDREPDPQANSNSERLVLGSDNFKSHREIFTNSAVDLIKNGTCTESDFLEMGGWVASTSQGPNVYFMYCGGMTVANRIYLDVSTGRVFQ
jgi:hypothetical protein